MGAQTLLAAVKWQQNSKLTKCLSWRHQ